MTDKRISPEEYLKKAIEGMNYEYGALTVMGRAHTEEEQKRYELLERSIGLVKKALEILEN